MADPVYYVLARERPVHANENPNDVRLIRIGAAFRFRNGRDGLVIKLNARPFGEWDGNMMLLPPTDRTADPGPARDDTDIPF